MASQIITYPRETFIHLGKSQTFQLSDEIIQIGKQLLEEIEIHLSKHPPKPHYSKVKENGGRYSKQKFHSSSTHYKKNRYSRSSNYHQPSMNTPLHVIWRNDVNTKIKEDVEKQLKLELNKLNDTNSQSIFQAVVDILKPVNNVQTDTIFINILFDIAVIQQNFCTHYVNLLQYLEKHYKPLSEEIIQTCKQYFKDSKQRVNEQQNFEELSHNKKKISGHFFFVGMLYKYQLVSLTVIQKYWKLLTDIIDSSEDINVLNVYSESMCRFLCAIGNIISKRLQPEFVQDKFLKTLSHYITQTSKFKPRLRFLFMDCIEKKHWID